MPQRGLWPNISIASWGMRTVLIHQCLFFQAFLNPRRQNDMFSLWPTLSAHIIRAHTADILRGPTRQLGISPRIIIIHNNMGQFRIIQVDSDDPSILTQSIGRFIQSTRVSYDDSISSQLTHLFATSRLGSDSVRPFLAALSAESR